MSPLASLRRRHATVQEAAARRINAELSEAASDLRARAQVFVQTGRPESARPFLEEAELFESARTPLLAS